MSFLDQMENLADVVGGNGRKGGKRWRLVFTSGFSLLYSWCYSSRLLDAIYLQCAGAQVIQKSIEILTAAVKCPAGKEQVSKGMKGEKAGGIYFPITAVQVDLQVLRLIH